MALLFVGVLVLGYRLGVSLASVAAYLVLLARAQPYAVTFGRARVEYASMYSSIGRVSWLLGQSPSSQSIGGSRTVASIDAAIEFDCVSYRYPDGRLALEEASFTIRPGVATALIGKSGAGKTTIVNLLCRIVEPSSGEIRHAGLPLPTVSPNEWRDRIAVAGQDVDLLDGTIEENISYGVRSVTHEEIVEAAKAARVHDFIEALADGYASHVTLHGLNLSGGQRQRIGLARALIRKPDLLILDEAVSAVDALSEREIVNIIRERRGFKTALVISHRQSSLQACEDAIVVEAGQVKSAGPLQSVSYFGTMLDG
jgi:subfamily B ATP-binding cassette protein MsbA